jgi:hypothetical protein
VSGEERLEDLSGIFLQKFVGDSGREMMTYGDPLNLTSKGSNDPF